MDEMKKRITLVHPLLIFIVAHLVWLSLLGLWIYWYVNNYLILQQVKSTLLPEKIPEVTNIVALILGLVMLVLLLIGMYFVFIFLAKQINITRMYDTFVANVSHELKSPLASIQMYLETLRMRNVPIEKQKMFVNLMIKDSQRLKSLINSILDISVIEQKKKVYDFKVYSVNKIVKDLIKKSCDQFKLPPNSIFISGGNSCYIKVDKDAMEIIFNNLIDNAIKYTVESFKMDIHIKCNSTRVSLDFIDKGIGIDYKNQRNIFHKFFRISDENIPNIKGTGLGLYIVKEIVKAHKGKISVFSKGVNLGSTFRIDLPVHKKTEQDI